MGLRKTKSVGNRFTARIHPEVFVQKGQSDHDAETELYALEHQSGKRILHRTSRLRIVSEYRVWQPVLGK